MVEGGGVEWLNAVADKGVVCRSEAVVRSHSMAGA
jgi:hypothetical protein